MDYRRNRHAQELFDGIADQYNWVPDLFSFFQYRRWRRDLVSRFQVGPHSTILDVCTGPAGVAMLMAQSHRCRVVGVDLSPEMLRRAQHNISSKGLTGQVPLVMGRAEDLAFASESFDAVSVTFLLRYVDDAESTMREIVRVLKPGGRLLSLEFGVPSNPIARALWHVYTRRMLPLAGALVSRGWKNVGDFLGPSITQLDQSNTEDNTRELWNRLGIQDVQVTRLSLGGAVVMSGVKGNAAQNTGR